MTTSPHTESPPPQKRSPLTVALTVVVSILLALYPFGIYFGLQVLSPRWLGVGLFLLFCLRLLTLRAQISSQKVWEFLPLFLGVVLTSLIVIFLDDPLFLRFNPALINLNFLVVFGHTLWRPPSMIERFARLVEPDLPPSGIRYTRHVTMVWCLFFATNGSIALWTAFQSIEIWTFYNGLLSYILIGILGGVEYIVRQWHKAHREEQP